MFPAALLAIAAPTPLSSVDALSGAWPLIAISLIISASLVALMYMMGNVLQSQDILGAAKDQLGNFVFTILIVGLFLGLFAVFSGLASIIACGSDGCNHLQAAQQSVLMLRSRFASFYGNLYFYEIVFGFLSTLGFSIPIPAISPSNVLGFMISMPSVSFSPLAGLTPISNAHTIVVEAVGTVLMAVIARQVILEFIIRYMYIFFALGVGMRAFFFTRRTGSSLLALAATAYFVLPLAMIFTNYAIFTAYQPTNFGVVPTAIGYCDDPAYLESMAEKFNTERQTLYKPGLSTTPSRWYMFSDFFSGAANFAWESLLGVKNVMFSFFGGGLSGLLKIVGLAVSPSLSPLGFSVFFDFLIIEIQSMVQFIVLAFSSFLIELVITITAYRSIAILMEGETEIFGISKLM